MTTKTLEKPTDRPPVHLGRQDMVRTESVGSCPSRWTLMTHATPEEILAPGWFDSAYGEILYVDDTILCLYGPGKFEARAAGSPTWRGGVKPHSRMQLLVTSREPKAEDHGRVSAWHITVEPYDGP